MEMVYLLIYGYDNWDGFLKSKLDFHEKLKNGENIRIRRRVDGESYVIFWYFHWNCMWRTSPIHSKHR